MEKLKIYSAYLPYKVKVKSNCGQIRELAMVDAENYCIASTETNGMIPIDSAHINGSGFKLILFSLEYLTKEIAVNGKIFVPIEYHAFKHNKEHLIDFQNNFAHYKSVKYGIIEKLLEWKFNVFNLPEDKYEKVTEDFNPYK